MAVTKSQWSNTNSFTTKLAMPNVEDSIIALPSRVTTVINMTSSGDRFVLSILSGSGYMMIYRSLPEGGWALEHQTYGPNIAVDVSISGDGARSVSGVPYSKAVDTYKRTGTTWAYTGLTVFNNARPNFGIKMDQDQTGENTIVMSNSYASFYGVNLSTDAWTLRQEFSVTNSSNVAMSNNGLKAAAIATDGTISLYSRSDTTWSFVKTFSGLSSINRCSMSADGNIIVASGGSSNIAYVVDVVADTVTTINPPGGVISFGSAIDISHDGTLIVIGASKKILYYSKSAGIWTNVHTLSDDSQYSILGAMLSVAGDKSRLVSSGIDNGSNNTAVTYS